MALHINQIVEADEVLTDGQWHYVRPRNYAYMSFLDRIRDAWLVLTGRADAVTWGGGQ